MTPFLPMVKVTKQFGFHAEHNFLNYFSIHAYPPTHFKSHVDTLHSTATAFIKNVAYLLPYFSTAFDHVLFWETPVNFPTKC